MTAVAAPLSIETFLFANRVQLQLCGELDVATAPVLRERLASAFSARPAELVLDVSELEFVDSSGLGMLLSAQKRSLEGGVALSICGAGPQLSQLLVITGLVEVLNVAEAANEFLAAGRLRAD
jgi:anti-anti-sigma factor